MSLTNSISHFTASLAGTLFGSLPANTGQAEQANCDTKYVEKPVGSDEENESDSSDSGQSSESSSSTKATDGQLAPAPWMSLDSRVRGENEIEDEEDRTESEDTTASPSQKVEVSKKQDKNEPDLELSEAEQKQVDELKQRDAEVRAHEQAHVAASGGHAQGGPTYEYQTGPDGKRYAVGGSVQLDVSPVPGDPEATVQKAQTIRKAAMAPAQPSSQDRNVAASASAMESQARVEAAEKSKDESGSSSATEGPNRKSDSAKAKSSAQIDTVAETEPAPGVLSMVAPTEPESDLQEHNPETDGSELGNPALADSELEEQTTVAAQKKASENAQTDKTERSPQERKGLEIYAQAMNQPYFMQQPPPTSFSVNA